MSQVLKLRIVLEKPPVGVAFGLQKGSGNQYEVLQTQSSRSEDLQFECTVQVKAEQAEAPNLLGPFVQGPKNGRFIYLDIGTLAGQPGSVWSRRLKIPLQGITWAMVEQMLANPDLILETRVPGTGNDGTPNCATVKPFDGWHLTLK
ncbi:MAG: DUF5990 family protein [Saprospiraceae bacterium]